jgi:hypothetical protein
MPTPAYQVTYHTNDASAWGTGVNRPLTWVEHDQSHWNLAYRISNLEATALGKTISYMAESNGSLFVHYSDHSIDGPFPLPIATFNWTGLWQPTHAYSVADTFQGNNSIYIVLIAHTSASTFDPNATDGLGHHLYQQMMDISLAGQTNVQTQAGTTWTPAFADANTYNRFTNAAGCAITLPTNASVPFYINTILELRAATSGAVSIAAAGGVTLHPQDAALYTLTGNGATALVKKIATDDWDVMGRLVLA